MCAYRTQKGPLRLVHTLLSFSSLICLWFSMSPSRVGPRARIFKTLSDPRIICLPLVFFVVIEKSARFEEWTWMN